jgi:GDSL-like lipase/acylhydrolase family protein
MESPAIDRRNLLLAGFASSLGLTSCMTAAPITAGVTTQYSDRPAVMAIGDSLYQGVRSLTFTAELARHSPPMQVAACLNLAMTAPGPPRPILFDLEAKLRQGGIANFVATARETCLTNASQWLAAGSWSGHEAFDNVAVGGAEIASLYTESFGTEWPKLRQLVAQIEQNPVPDLAAIGQLWYSLNTCFTLNPRQREEQASKTQLDQVRERQPKLLLVNIGSNEGLFRAAFLGAFDQKTLDSVAAIPKKMEPLADHLASLPATVETIAFNSLVRPRTASNLMPGPNANRGGIYVGDGYYSTYGPWITGTAGSISGDTLKHFDQLTQDVNGEVRAMMERKVGSRLRFVDLYAASTGLDGKHYRDRALLVHSLAGRQLQLRDIPLTRQVIGPQEFTGGLTGLDNMHPTVPGYAAIADAVLAAIAAQARTDKDAAFRADTLLNDIPFFLPVAQFELRELGRFGVLKNFTRGTSI